MNEISRDDWVKVAEWMGAVKQTPAQVEEAIEFEMVRQYGEYWDFEFSPAPFHYCKKELIAPWLITPEGQITIMKKIWTFAALHLEEIPKPEAVIMPFCDIAGRDDYEGHGETIEDALINAVLEVIKQN